MEGEKISATLLLYLFEDVSALPSKTEAFSLAETRLEEMEEVFLHADSFDIWKKKACFAIGEAFASGICLAYLAGASEYTHIMHVYEKEAGPACEFARKALGDYASSNDEKDLCLFLGAILDASLLFGLSYEEIEAEAVFAIKHWNEPMRWRLCHVDKETDHPYLNFYTLHYYVITPNGKKDYSYFLASRNEEGNLLAVKNDHHRPDGVIMVLFAKGQDGQKRLLLNRQFRPAINEYVYSLPAGLMDEGDESIGETARREAREEAGAILGEVSLLVRPSPTSEGLSDELDCIVMADVIGIDKTHREAFEDIASNALSKEEFASLLDDEEAIIPLPLRALALYLLETWESKTDTGIA